MTTRARNKARKRIHNKLKGGTVAIYERTQAGGDSAESAANLPTDWQTRIPQVFPDYATHPMAARHAEFWDWANAIQLGVKPRSFVAIWPRGGGKSTSVEMLCTDLAIRGVRKYLWYVCANQDSADRHVLTISNMLQDQTINPAVAAPKISKTGNRRWNRTQVITSSGFSIEAIGLDKAVRGGKIDADRPDGIIFDDIDAKHDTTNTISKKLETITTSILPAASSDGFALFAQNLIHQNSIASKLVGDADFMLDRVVSGPHVAVDNMVTEYRYNDEYEKHMPYIVEGDATWEGQSLDICQRQMWQWGLGAFNKESQHLVKNLGDFFKREWFEIVDTLPSGCTRFVRYWDNAATKGGGDYTAGVLMAMKGGVFYVVDVVRGRWATDERRKIQKSTSIADQEKFGRNTSYQTVQEQEGGSAGVDAARDLSS